MKPSTAFFFILAIVSSLVAAPLTSLSRRSRPGKRGFCWPFYNAPPRLRKAERRLGYSQPPPPVLCSTLTHAFTDSYDYETTLPSSSNGNGGLNFIGMQRCLDCASSPVADLATRQQQLGFSTVFTLNKPNINGITPKQAATWYIQNINPLVRAPQIPNLCSINERASRNSHQCQVDAHRCQSIVPTDVECIDSLERRFHSCEFMGIHPPWVRPAFMLINAHV
ncbi:hypothetical protein B0H14DRAFT_2359959 [Mycena olivaceomarginata]|nr:hypothetical protein B0H14DRAFT_2359959 [Mycena olivaceomarginata]